MHVWTKMSSYDILLSLIAQFNTIENQNHQFVHPKLKIDQSPPVSKFGQSWSKVIKGGNRESTINGFISARWPPKENLNALSFLRLHKLKKKVPSYFDLEAIWLRYSLFDLFS